MSKHKPGTYEAAFPILSHDMRQDYAFEQGISKRLYIAVEAMKAFLSDPECGFSSKNELVKEAYSYADIMLAQEYEGTQIE